MLKEKKWWKRYSSFQIVAFVLTVLFIVGIIITIGVLVHLKNKINDTKKKNEELEDILQNDDAKALFSIPEQLQKLYESKLLQLMI